MDRIQTGGRRTLLHEKNALVEELGCERVHIVVTSWLETQQLPS